MRESHKIQRLVVLGSTVTALAIVRNCHRIGLPCTVIDTLCGAAARSRLAEVEVLGSNEEVERALVERLSGKATALIADSDRWLRWLMQHREMLEAEFRLILHPPNSVLSICLNKTRFVRWCQEHTLPVPDLYENPAGNGFSDIRFPVLVRPELTRHGSADDLPKAVEIASQAQLVALLECYENLGATPNICQSLLRPNTRQYSVGVARDRHGESRILVAEKIRPTAAKCAGGTYVIATPNNRVASLVIDAISELGLYGIAEVEVLEDVDTAELFLLEVNARPWVQYALALRSGFDFLTFLVRPDSYDPDRERVVGMRWLSFGDDLYTVFSRSEGLLKTDDVSLLEYLRTVIRANAFPLWSLRDPNPWFESVKARIHRVFSRRGGVA